MQRYSLIRQSILALALALLASRGAAQDNTAAGQLVSMGSTNPNRFGLSYHMGLNISAEFHNLGGFSSLAGAGAGLRTPSGDLYNYDNGYVYPDTTAGHPGYTWYYGYNGSTPMRPAGAPTEVDQYRSSAPANATSSDTYDGPQHGLELTYNRQLGRLGRGSWGIEAGFAFTDVTIHNNQALSGTVTRNADTYRTGGDAILKPEPFAGTADGPAPNDPAGWPLVSLTPAASSTTSFAGAATITGDHQFDSQMFSFRVGPYLDYPLSRRWTASLSGGLAVVEINSDYKYTETVSLNPAITLTTLPSQTHSGSGSQSDWLVGAYIGGTLSYALSERFRIFGGAQWQYTGDYSQTVNGKEAVLKLGASVFVPIGITYSF
jgi:hypothetical protein